MYDLQWRKFTAMVPKEGQAIFVRSDEGLHSTNFCKSMLDYNPLFYGEAWCDAEPVLNAPDGFDPKMAGKMCLCGHPYHRHFDSYENWAPVGCKYCHGYVEGVTHRKETKPPAGLSDEEWTEWWVNHPRDKTDGICTGFKEDPDAEPEECEWAEGLVLRQSSDERYEPLFDDEPFDPLREQNEV